MINWLQFKSTKKCGRNRIWFKNDISKCRSKLFWWLLQTIPGSIYRKIVILVRRLISVATTWFSGQSARSAEQAAGSALIQVTSLTGNRHLKSRAFTATSCIVEGLAGACMAHRGTPQDHKRTQARVGTLQHQVTLRQGLQDTRRLGEPTHRLGDTHPLEPTHRQEGTHRQGEHTRQLGHHHKTWWYTTR